MKPNHNNTRRRRRPNLPLPQPQIAVPSPLPPSSAPMSNQHQHLNLSDFDRINRIGSGSWGTVYKVLHRPTATHFALKVIYGSHDEDVRRQILHEIKILHDIDNVNIVKCHGMFDHDGEIQVFLEYMDGGSLHATHLSDESSLADFTRQILSGLSYLHRQKIAHRQIKPSSLLTNSIKQVKIGVSGVTRILEQTTYACRCSAGTIAYLSPERINTDLNQGKDDGYAGDIWSMGVSILEIYIGVLPFEIERQDDWASLMCAICMSPPPKAPATASREFQDFVECCLQRDPAKRWTAAQLLGHPFVTGAAIVDVSTTISHESVSTQ